MTASQISKRYLVFSVGSGMPPEQTDNLKEALRYNDTGEYYVIDSILNLYYELGNWEPIRELPPFQSQEN